MMLELHNDSLSPIALYRITLRTAQSYNATLKGYRDNNFPAFIHQSSQGVAASDSKRSIWLVRKEPDKPDLLVGNDSQHPLQWPPKDLAPEHFWLFAIHIDAFATPKTGNQNPTPLDPIEMQIVVCWDKETNDFSVHPSIRTHAN